MAKRKSKTKNIKINNKPLWVILILIASGIAYVIFLSGTETFTENIKISNHNPNSVKSINKPEKHINIEKNIKQKEIQKKQEENKQDIPKKEDLTNLRKNKEDNEKISKVLEAFDRTINELKINPTENKKNKDTIELTEDDTVKKSQNSVKATSNKDATVNQKNSKLEDISPSTTTKSEDMTEKKDKVELIPVSPIAKPVKTAFNGKELSAISSKNKIALTFDAGSSPVPTSSILKTLKEKNVTATFFLTGEWISKNPELTRQIIASGNEIGNHSFSHKDFKKLSKSQIIKELDDTNAQLNKTAGMNCVPFFRAPYGSRNQEIINIVFSKGYTHIYWAVDSWDSVKKDITASEIYSRVTTFGKAGDIILLHCGSNATAMALPKVIDKFKSDGIIPSKISNML